jgi:hypothetical protein
MPLLYVLHQPVSVDSKDSAGHTSLMWAAYQGDALSVDLLLKHGASTNTRDDAGLSPLHWAVVRGNRVCIRKLIEAGADISAKDADGRTAKDMAVELKALGPWRRALEEGGFNEDGLKKKKPLSEVRRYTPIYHACADACTAKYKNNDFWSANRLPLADVYDTGYSTMVHRGHPRHGTVLCYAPRTSYHLERWTDTDKLIDRNAGLA